uniref:Uncharacterized protein n=1 Tax=Sphingomonas abietis TaxID=3012344 RepID=A0ABY7NQT4_9SPHN|nr:hypothetical protein [Sphingomonas abietis]WBO23907.1 hypothetical protein PBT88_07305 [Sphingomonas abietis]
MTEAEKEGAAVVKRLRKEARNQWVCNNDERRYLVGLCNGIDYAADMVLAAAHLREETENG